jgi:hypothetical protein
MQEQSKDTNVSNGIPMTWIDEDSSELRRVQESAAELAARNHQIANSGETIYNDLWREIVERIKEAKDKGLPYAANLITNGDPDERRIFNHRIVIPQPIKPPVVSSSPKHIIIKLTADHLKIEISGLKNSAIYLLLDVGEDGVILPKFEGEFRTIQETARLILRPILFPELFSIV